MNDFIKMNSMISSKWKRSDGMNWRRQGGWGDQKRWQQTNYEELLAKTHIPPSAAREGKLWQVIVSRLQWLPINAWSSTNSTEVDLSSALPSKSRLAYSSDAAMDTEAHRLEILFEPGLVTTNEKSEATFDKLSRLHINSIIWWDWPCE